MYLVPQKKIKHIKLYSFLFPAFLFIFGCAQASYHFNDGISIKDNRIFIDGEKFIIKAVGYAPWRPGQWPGTDVVGLDIMEADFKRISTAGFNTIRTWDALTSEQLYLAAKYKLKVIQGVWLDPNRDFSDSRFIKMSVEYVSEVVNWSKGHNNVLMYLVMTEPHPWAVNLAGDENTIKFFKRIKKIIQDVDYKPFAVDSWIPIGDLDHSFCDIAVFNAFMFVPESINSTIGFDNYIRWIKRHHANKKPLLIGETGGFSVSSKNLNNIGFGGNSQEQQSEGNINSIKVALREGSAGTVLVSWIDTWHYPSDPQSHDDHPWEWDGLLEFSGPEDKLGTPRKAYFGVQELNQKLMFPETSDKTGTLGQVRYLSDKKVFSTEENVEIRLNFTFDGIPLKNKKVKVGFWSVLNDRDFVMEYVTDHNGDMLVQYLPEGYKGFDTIVVSAGFNHEKSQYGDIFFIKIKEKQKALIVGEHDLVVFADKKFPGNNFIPSGWVGDFKAMSFNDGHQQNPHSGQDCIKISYDAEQSLSQRWVGIYWQNSLNNWWDSKQAYDLKDYKKISFWARGEEGGEVISEFGVGGKSPNSSDISGGPIVLTNDWQEYELDISNSDVSTIIHGFRLFMMKKDNPRGVTVYLDNIIFAR